MLADSSIVTLALPSILRQFDAKVSQVAWVLIAFNLALALAAVPVARVAARGPSVPLFVGLGVFAIASACCALAPSLGALIAARIVQALGGAAIVCSACSGVGLRISTASMSSSASNWSTSV